MTGAAQNIHALPSTTSGFSHYVLFVYKPKRAGARALVDRMRKDPAFPRAIHQRSTLDCYLRHRPWPWAERRAGGEIWCRYAAWARGQAKIAA